MASATSRASAPLRTVGQTVRSLTRSLRAARVHSGHGAADARIEAAWLVSATTGIPFEDLEQSGRMLVDGRTAARIDRILARRVEDRIPLAYLLREAWLGGLRFRVDRRVIIPRSFIAELLAERLAPWGPPPRASRRILDLCTGSGCLAVLAARAFPHSRLDAVDLSSGALAVARRNVLAHHLAGRIRLVRSDLFSALGSRRYDLILANPPYVTRRAMDRLPGEYRHEPALALYGGVDGLDLVARILRAAPDHLSPQGTLVLEIGHNRTAFERRFPRLVTLWPSTSAGEGVVCALSRHALEECSRRPDSRSAPNARARSYGRDPQARRKGRSEP